MSRVLVTLVVVSTMVCLEAQSLPPDLPVFPRELEMELALNAAPPHLRDGASVLGPNVTDADIGGQRSSPVEKRRLAALRLPTRT